MENMGWSSGNQYDAILKFYTESSGSKTSNVYIYNNVISSSSSTHNLGIDIRNLGTMSNFNIKNNIIVGCNNNGFLRIDDNGSWDGFHVDNNIFYNN